MTTLFFADLRVRTITLILLIGLGFSTFAASEKNTSSLEADRWMSRGSAAFQRGDIENAVESWSKAADLYRVKGDVPKEIDTLIQLASGNQALGVHEPTVKILHRALTLAESQKDPLRTASILNNLGSAYWYAGLNNEARHYILKGLVAARKLGAKGIRAAALNNLGNLLASEKKLTQAFAVYKKSSNIAAQQGDSLLAGKVATNAVKVALQNDDTIGATAILEKALKHIRSTQENHEKAYQLIALGQLALQISRISEKDADHWRLKAFNTLREAADIATSINDPRAISYTSGYLGILYYDEQRFPEALQLTRRAIHAIQNLQAPEILYRWQWQSGRLLKAQGHTEQAISSYQKSIQTLESVRQDLSTGYRSGLSSFRQEVGPVYLELADLLLQASPKTDDQVKLQQQLVDARNVVERLKAAELRDYFQDGCVTALQQKITPLEGVAAQTAAVYPILLSDRAEILLSLPDGIKQYTVKVDRETLTSEVRAFRNKLEKRTSREFVVHAQTLYDWLIRPLEADLDKHQISTLVFIPDGPLRTVPMAALHDGQEFLISRYATSTTPGLNLIDPKPISRDRIELLANGLTKPVQGFPPLPHVSSELQTIQNLYGGQLLQDDQFLLSRLQNELADKPYTVLHIASHGQFTSDPKQTFVLTFDNKLTMDRLEQLIGLSRFRDDPVELLTLSACQTAAGDDRAALGLAGIAIKAGARSALATLWFINDEASSKLVTEFYRQLKKTDLSKAKALQNAQLKLLTESPYKHPGYWAPFLLIGNWM